MDTMDVDVWQKKYPPQIEQNGNLNIVEDTSSKPSWKHNAIFLGTPKNSMYLNIATENAMTIMNIMTIMTRD